MNNISSEMKQKFEEMLKLNPGDKILIGSTTGHDYSERICTVSSVETTGKKGTDDYGVIVFCNELPEDDEDIGNVSCSEFIKKIDKE